jgi:hypothetical protein
MNTISHFPWECNSLFFFWKHWCCSAMVKKICNILCINLTIIQIITCTVQCYLRSQHEVEIFTKLSANKYYATEPINTNSQSRYFQTSQLKVCQDGWAVMISFIRKVSTGRNNWGYLLLELYLAACIRDPCWA